MKTIRIKDIAQMMGDHVTVDMVRKNAVAWGLAPLRIPLNKRVIVYNRLLVEDALSLRGLLPSKPPGLASGTDSSRSFFKPKPDLKRLAFSEFDETCALCPHQSACESNENCIKTI